MNAQHIEKYIEQDFTVSSGGTQVLGVAHTLSNNGDSARVRVFANGRDTSGGINIAEYMCEVLAYRESGAVTMVSAWTEIQHADDNGGNMLGIQMEVDGDELRVKVGFGGWSSGTQYATACARVEIDIL